MLALETIWTLPQTLIGALLLRYYKKRRMVISSDYCRIGKHTFTLTYHRRNFLSGASLGEYIFLSEDYLVYKYNKTVLHEYGHYRQSLMLGWFYLLLVGVPSAFNNLMARRFKYFRENYYSLYPEKWADKLGGVDRE